MPLNVDDPGAAAERIRFSDHKDQVVLVLVGGTHRAMNTANGVCDAVRGTFIPLSGPNAENWYPDSVIFNARAVGRLQDRAGTIAAGLVTQEPGRNGAVDFEPLAPQWKEYAQQWVDQHETDVRAGLDAAVTAFHRAEQNRKDKAPLRGSLMEQARNMPAVPNGAADKPAPSMPVGDPKGAGPDMPALPSQTLASTMAGAEAATEEEAGF